MKKEDIYVTISSEKDRLKVLNILLLADERIFKDSMIYDDFGYNSYNVFFAVINWCGTNNFIDNKKRIKIGQLAKLLNVEEVYERLQLIKKEREFKVSHETYISIPREVLGKIYGLLDYKKRNILIHLLLRNPSTHNPFPSKIDVDLEIVNKLWEESTKSKYSAEITELLTKYAPKPKTKVIKEVVKYINIYTENYKGININIVYDSLGEAKKYSCPSHYYLETIELKGIREIEE